MAMTPMMTHYLNMKDQNPDAILFYRLGDFYEMFFEDAKLVSRELDLTLTGKDCGMEERAPMCGVPFHAADQYIARLINKGYKVAICEQMEDPALAKGLVKRDVIRVITPGTVIETNMLEEKRSNYIMAICLRRNQAGIAFCDVSTGELFAYQLAQARQKLNDDIARIDPREVLSNDVEGVSSIIKGVRVGAYADEKFTYSTAANVVKAQFSADAEEMGFADEKFAISAVGALLAYLSETQKIVLSHIIKIKRYTAESFVALDRTALKNLELTQSIRGTRKGSLLAVLDHARTAMGSRLLKTWIEQPLCSKIDIENRLDSVDEFIREPITAERLREQLSEIYDIERLLSKIAYESVSARDCLSLKASLEMIPVMLETGDELKSYLSRELFAKLDPMLALTELLRQAISPDAPMLMREGGIIKSGYNVELDKFRDISTNSKAYIAKLEQKERENTGIKGLKVGYNRVFGYFIEISKSNNIEPPSGYTRKQTLANGERYITNELKKLEAEILGAEESALHLETELFGEIRNKLKEALPTLQRTAESLKNIDALLSLAQAADENGYVRPSINNEGCYNIVNGRHPVVEEAMGRENFVPNDTNLDENQRVMIITGPNMAGKSTYMRQVALIVLMAHIGSFVPADSADVSLTDRVFTRIGASDDLYSGLSTFMVEMTEMSTILNNATSKSLVILDEVGRGTSTFDGLSIAWAAVEYIASEKCGARTLFATHYHELSELEGQLTGVVNYRITAKEQGETVIFLRKIVPGGEDRSYGVAVAKLAGLPNSVVARARQILARLEVDDEQNGSIGKTILDKRKNAGDRQMGIIDVAPMALVEDIQNIDVTAMTPIEALNKLYELCEKARRI